MLSMVRASQNRANICMLKNIKRSLDEKEYDTGNYICKSNDVGKNKKWISSTNKMSTRMKYAKSICTNI